MRILENFGPRVHILLSMIFSSEFVTIWVVTRGRGSRQTVTKSDKGEGDTNRDIHGDILFEWPLNRGRYIFHKNHSHWHVNNKKAH